MGKACVGKSILSYVLGEASALVMGDRYGACVNVGETGACQGGLGGEHVSHCPSVHSPSMPVMGDVSPTWTRVQTRGVIRLEG